MPFDGIEYERRIQALEKMDKVIGLLSDERRWCKRRLQTHDGRYCVLGAIKAVGAESELREPILIAIEQVTGRNYLRIERFNDDPLTTHTLVVKVLQQARLNITNPETALVEQRVTRWERLCRVFV